MRFAAGERIGPYEIVERLGAGGMGEVFKARDTRLDRFVAIKTSNEKFSERFQREAQAIASLNHPHICTLHDVGPDYLVMEYINGRPLRGPLPVAEALQFAIQIADAVSEAHRHGVVHRDLKPANILVTKSGVKVLDFGLAKLSRVQTAAGVSQGRATTMTQHILTQEGTVVGTPQYMAPEQLEGRETDERTDIFAFGLVLYEMLTGSPAFTGKTQASLIASIMAAEPKPVTGVQPLTPPGVDHLLRTCLAKDPDQRRQNMYDTLLELRWIAEQASQAGLPAPPRHRRKRREWLSWAAAVGALAAVSAMAAVHFREQTPVALPARFQFHLPADVRMDPNDVPVISPDGRIVAVPAIEPGGVRRLWVRQIDNLIAKPLPGTEGASIYPFWSPDSRFVGFFTADGKLKRIDIQGGAAVTLAEAGALSSGSWGSDGAIVFSREGRLFRVASSGGEATLLLELDQSRKELRLRFPTFLEDGRLLYSSLSEDPALAGTYVLPTGSKTPQRLTHETGRMSSASGHLLFARQTTLLAQPFDAGKLLLAGDPATLVGDLHTYSVSATGTLVYRSPALNTQQFVWYDREGRRLGNVGEANDFVQFQIAPGGRRLSVLIRSAGRSGIWQLDLATGILSPLSTAAPGYDHAVWSPDGQEVAFTAAGKFRRDLYRKPVGGSQQTVVLASDTDKFVEQWLPDNSLLYLDENGRTFYRLRLAPGAEPEELLRTEYSKDEPQVSRDGKWVAYNTNESGRWEVYVAAFPAFDQRRQVSSGGGVQAHWRNDGKELYYLALDGTLMAVPVKTDPVLDPGVPQKLFRTSAAVWPTRDQFAVLDEGRRFLFLEPDKKAEHPITVILNWPALLRR